MQLQFSVAEGFRTKDDINAIFTVCKHLMSNVFLSLGCSQTYGNVNTHVLRFVEGTYILYNTYTEIKKLE